MFETGGLAVCDHKDLLVGVLTTTEQLHSELESGYCVGMVWAYLQVGEVFHLYLPGIVAEDHYIECVLGVAGGDEFAKSHGYFAGGGNAVLAIKYHGVRYVDHEDGRGLRFVVGLVDLEIVFAHIQSLYAVIDKCVSQAVGIVNRLRSVAKLVGACFGIGLIALAGLEGAVGALFSFFHLPEDLLERALSYGLLCFSRKAVGAVGLIFLQIALVFEILDEVAQAVVVVGEAVFPVELSEPAESLRNIAAGVLEQVGEKVQ